MKNIILIFLIFMGFASCNKQHSQKDMDLKNQSQKPVNAECYIAFYEQDTVQLQLNTLKNGKLSGTMQMKFINMPVKKGTIAGEFRGDTLFADYTFFQGTNDKVIFKNPMALLKRNNELIMGNGKIVTYLGASYFAKGEPIDFNNVKFKFTVIDCVQKKN